VALNSLFCADVPLSNYLLTSPGPCLKPEHHRSCFQAPQEGEGTAGDTLLYKTTLWYLLCLTWKIFIYLPIFICPERTKHIMAIAYSGQSSEATTVLNIVLNTTRKQDRIV